MNLKRYIIILLLTLGGVVNGATYYVSKAGDNTTGLSWAHAWNDSTTALTSVETNVVGGDTVFFGAGIWVGQITPPGNGTSGDRTCYADSGLSLNPIEYTGLSHITGATILTGWAVYSGSVYKTYYPFTIPSGEVDQIYTMAQDDSLLDRESSIGGVDNPGEFYYDLNTDSFYIYCYESANPNSCVIKVADKIVIDVVSANSYITFIGLEVSYGNKILVRLSGTQSLDPNYISTIHCTLHHLSGKASENATLIGVRGDSDSDSSHYAHGDTIRACTLYAFRDESGWWSHNKGICFYEAIGCVVESCSVTGGGIGINFKCDNGGPAPYNVIRYNFVTGAGNGIDLYGYHIFDSIYGNVITNSYNNGDGWGITIEGRSTDSACRIFNNTLIDVLAPFVVGPYTSTGIEGSGDNRYFFKYNIVDYTNSKDLLTYNDDVTDTANMVWDSNYYYRGGGAITIDNVGSFAAWQAAGFDVHTTVADPGLNASYEPTGVSAWTSPITYGGRTWYGPGAVQTLWEPVGEFDKFVKLKNIKNTGGIKLK